MGSMTQRNKWHNWFNGKGGSMAQQVNSTMRSVAQWGQWYDGINGTIESMVQWDQWHNEFNGPIRAQCGNRFNGKMGLMAQ